MIPLGKEKHVLTKISADDFWSYLDEITCGQALNPELGYSTPFYGNFENVFGGRKRGNTFTVFLYRPITSGFRTEILAKGKVRSIKEDALSIEISYELPFWSFSIFCLIQIFPIALIFINWKNPTGWFSALFLFIVYALVVWFNFEAMKKELNAQLEQFK